GGAYRANGVGRANRAGNLRVAGRAAGRHRTQPAPHALLKWRPVELDLDRVECLQIAGEIRRQRSYGTPWILAVRHLFAGEPSRQQRPHLRLGSEPQRADATVV